MRKAFTLVELMIAMIMLASVGGIIALVIVAVHFLAKYW